LQPAAIEQVSLVNSLPQFSKTVTSVSLLTTTGWQKSSVNNGIFSGLVVSVVSFPCLHWQPSLQSATTVFSTHVWMRLTSVVGSIGAQKSPSGINSFPSDQLQPALSAHETEVSDLTQFSQTDFSVVSETTTGWQKSAENNGLVYTTGFCSETGYHLQVDIML